MRAEGVSATVPGEALGAITQYLRTIGRATGETYTRRILLNCATMLDDVARVPAFRQQIDSMAPIALFRNPVLLDKAGGLARKAGFKTRGALLVMMVLMREADRPVSYVNIGNMLGVSSGSSRVFYCQLNKWLESRGIVENFVTVRGAGYICQASAFEDLRRVAPEVLDFFWMLEREGMLVPDSMNPLAEAAGQKLLRFFGAEDEAVSLNQAA